MNGVINVIKPPGMSSSGVVVYLRRVLGEKKTGHAGTLDPGAAGVLPVLAGRSTRLSEIVMNHRKSYIAEVTFGTSTDTLDSYGAVTGRADCDVSESQVKKLTGEFTGDMVQIPPHYSAVKVAGQKSYKLARSGVATEKPPRNITIYSNELVRQTGKNRFLIRVACSKGTYIRKLAEDMGARLGLPAYLSFLLRDSSGGFSIEDGYTLDEIAEMASIGDTSFLKKPEEILGEMPRIDTEDKTAISNGGVIREECPTDGYFRVYCENELYGLALPCEGGYKLDILLRDQL